MYESRPMSFLGKVMLGIIIFAAVYGLVLVGLMK